MITRRRLIKLSAASIFAPAIAVRAARAQAWPDRPIHMIVPIAAGGPDRHQRAHRCRPNVQGFGPASGGRQQERRRHQYRQRFRRPRRARRLHHPVRDLIAFGERRALPRARLQSHHRSRAGFARRQVSVLHVRAEFIAGKNSRGVHCARQGKARQADHGLAGDRKRAASHRIAVHADGADPDDPRALPRRGAGLHRPHTRPHRLLFRQRRTAHLFAIRPGARSRIERA